MFRFTQPTYIVGEANGPGLPAIELFSGTLTFPIDVQVATVPGGSATRKCIRATAINTLMNMASNYTSCITLVTTRVY